MRTVRLAFIGAGNMGQCAHLRNYVGLPDVQLTALAELRPTLAREVAARYGIARVYADHRALLAAEKIDGIVSIQDFNLHGQLIPDLFAVGVPILTEKPLANSVFTGRQMLDRLAQSKATHFVAYHKRSDPATVWARRQIDVLRQDGTLGPMRYLRITMPPGDWIAAMFSTLIRTGEKLPPLTRDPAPPQVSAAQHQEYIRLVNYYIHQVNLLRHLLGCDYQITHADPSGLVALIKADNGTIATLEMAPYQTTVDWQETALVCFERGWVRLDLPSPGAIDRPGRVLVYRDPGRGSQPTTIEPQLPFIHAMRQQAMHFVSAIRGEDTPLCTAQEAIKDLMTMEQYLDRYLAAGGTLPEA